MTSNQINLKRAIIVGASSGIGKEMALYFANQGWNVAVLGRRKKLLDELRQSQQRLLPYELDINETKSLSDELQKIVDDLGGLDLFVISAGTGFLNNEFDFSKEQATIKTNVESFARLTCWSYHFFKQQGYGQIAAITSVAGLYGGSLSYSASKAFQINYIKTIRSIAKKECPNLTVTELRPGSVETDMMKGKGHFWISKPKQAGEIACKAILKRKKLQYISGRWRAVGALLKLSSLWG